MHSFSSVYALRYSLWPRSRSALVLLATLSACGLMAVSALRIGAALTLGESKEVENLARANTLDPNNAELQFRLGLSLFYSLQDPDLAGGLEHLRRAVRLNPLRAVYWAGLGVACRSAGERDCAIGAFEKAVGLSPMAPRYHWLAANCYLWANQRDDAIAQFHELLGLVSATKINLGEEAEQNQYVPATFRLCLDMTDDPEVVLRRVLPTEQIPKLKLAFVQFLYEQNRLDSASRVWDEVVGTARPFPLRLAAPYVDGLIFSYHFDQAIRVWQGLERLGVVKDPPKEDLKNLVFNGGFEQPPLNSGLDWHYVQKPYVSIDFFDKDAYRGTHCFRLAFTLKQNEDYESVIEFVPVLPGQSYAVTAYVRSRDITSDSGPRLRVLDPVRPSELDTSTDGTIGTTPWHQLKVTFTTAAETHAVRLSIFRPRSRAFPFEISGDFWLDEVRLEALAAGAGEGASWSGGSSFAAHGAR